MGLFRCNIHKLLATVPLLSFLLLISGCLRSDTASGNDTDLKESVRKETSDLDDKKEEPMDGRISIASDRGFREAPSLKKKVLAGELPPVDERLPFNPLVITPEEEPGKYGGTIRRALIADIIDQTAIAKSMSENLMCYERPFLEKILPNLSESHAFSEDGKSVVFRIREGIRWSDGVPFTVDDIIFWYEDVARDENARDVPLFPSRWLNRGNPVELRKLDPYSLEISSHKPLGMILNTLCYDEIALPKHHFSRFHPNYNDEATYADFRARTTLARLAYEPGTPRLSAWFPVSWVRGQSAVFERNPYYWKVDTAGNQLPYVDRLEFVVIPSINVMQLKFFNGELDLFGRYFDFRMFQTLKQEEAKGHYTVYISEPRPYWSFYLNWEAKRPALGEAFRDRRVRVALSHALNREEINQIVFNGLLIPRGVAFNRSSPFYSDDVVSRYAQYDPEKARMLLDEAGYRDQDGDGVRELKDGSPFELILDIFADTEIPDMCELAAGHWADVGIKSHLNIALQEIIEPRRINGDFEVHIYRAPTDPIISSELVSKVGPSEPFWHRSARPDESAWLFKMTALIEEAKITLDPDLRRVLVEQISDLYVDNLPFIYLGEIKGVWAASNRLGNVPKRIHQDNYSRGWDRGILSEQLFFSGR